MTAEELPRARVRRRRLFRLVWVVPVLALAVAGWLVFQHLRSMGPEIAITFKRAPYMLFRGTKVGHVPPNVMVLHLQPDEGISLSFQAKVPGPVLKMDEATMHFDYAERFGATPSTGYETLVYDCMCGDATLFQRADDQPAAGRKPPGMVAPRPAHHQRL